MTQSQFWPPTTARWPTASRAIQESPYEPVVFGRLAGLVASGAKGGAKAVVSSNSAVSTRGGMLLTWRRVSRPSTPLSVDRIDDVPS
jgi:hypothetical protein